TEERGFSYQHDAPLDMRMDQRQELTAATVVNTYSAKELAQVIREYGEERFANRIAQRIVARREDHPLTTTGELLEVIKAAIPAAKRRTGPHPAKRTFQAIRIEVNGELRGLETAVRNAVKALNSGGKIGIISFHSLEDRIIKHTFRDLARDCICPPELPVCQCGHKATLRNVSKAIRPTEQELENNPRARSAILRVAEKV
ncbi:MAG: 16S rRNA (cytosine(1402)-N(4))-methyltransferase RsmH, partial [Negativicoccus succinicivorans]|nr:16S rRNA (cytosine(1402)-N(4))-methyltransferase RsmH [Negativicoccus succinicivorans]